MRDQKTGRRNRYDTNNRTPLAPITVEGWRTSTTVGYRAEGISSATKTDALLVDVPASVSVVTEQVIDDQRATSVAEALRNVPGVGIGPNPANVSVQEEATVRGFESALVRVNGVQRRSTGPLSLANVASVEVLKGPFSVLYGDLSPGGFVNIQTKRPQAESAAAASVGGAQVAGNRGTTGRASVDLTGPVNEAGSVLYRFIASAEGGSAFIDTVDNERYFIAPSLSYLGLDGRLRVDLDLSYLRNDESFLFGIPSRNDRPDTRIGYDRFLGAADGSKLTEDYTAELRAEYALDERTQFDAALTYHLNEHDSRALRPFGSPGQQVAEDDTVRRSYSLRVFETDDLQFETNVVHEIFTDTTEWRFMAGGDVRRTTVAHAGPGFGNIVDFDRVEVLDPDNAAALPAPDDPRISFFDRAKQATDAYGAYVQAEVWLHDTWKLLAGLRYSDVDYTFKDPSPFFFNERANKFSPRFGVLYKATPWTSLYASYSTSFEQALSFAPEDPGDPTEAAQIETGIKQEFFGGRLFATLSGFRIVQENLLQPDPDDPSRSIQIGEARTQGLELEINGELAPGLNLVAGYALLDNEISQATDGTEGNRLPNVARHEASLWLTYDLFRNSREGLTVGAGVFAESNRFTSTQNRTRMPGYATADLMAQYRFTANDTDLQLRAGVKNLFDREYYVGGFGEGISFRGEPRSVYVQLDARF